MIIFITGISGAGKNTALRILEDSGFYCIDNSPLDLVPKIIEIAENSKISNIAFIIDPRIIFTTKKNYSKPELEKDIKNFVSEILNLAEKYNIKILFLDCDEKTLLKRYNSNRRTHPLNAENILEGIKLEKELLQNLKEKSHYIVDTSELSPYNLASKISELILSKKLNILKIISFGYKYGFVNSDFVIDVRMLKNPFYIKELASKNGLDQEIKEYLLNDSKTIEFLENTLKYLEYILSIYFSDVKNFLEVGIGCTGGKHRSVFVAEYIYDYVSKKYNNIKVLVEHRDIYKN